MNRYRGFELLGIGSVLPLALIGMAVFMGCDPDVPQRDEPTDRIEAIFDPETETIPMPNDVAMDEDGTLPGIPGAEAGGAEELLSDFLDVLEGWPRTTPIEIPFSAPLDEESIDDQTVRMYRIGTEQELTRVPAETQQREGEDGTSVLEVMPGEPAVADEQYAVVATDGLAGAEGQTVGAPLPIFLAASESPLVDDDGRPQLDILADDPETAQTLEGLRLMLAPIYEGVESGVGDDEPLDRDEVAMAFRWTTMPETALAFYPDFAQLPIPNTAALDDDGTFPDAATCHAGEQSAAGTLDDYLAGLSGWPAETPITIELTGEIDPSSIGNDDVQLWRRAGDEWERDEFADFQYRDYSVDPCGEEHPASVIAIEPGDPIEIREEYFAVVSRDIEPVDAGEQRGAQPELIPEPPMFLTLQPSALVDDQGQSMVSTLTDEEAQQIEAIRSSIAPAIQKIEDEYGFAYDDLAGLWSWYTWDDTFVTFDPESGKIPFPNGAIMEEGTVNLPIPDGASDSQQALFEQLNQRQGFSTTAPISLPLNGKLDEDSLDFDAFRILDEGSLSMLEEEQLDLRVESQVDRLVLEPTTPLPDDTMLVVALRDDLRGVNGRPIQASPFVTLLTGQHPVAEEGESLVDLLSDDAAVQLEENRAQFNTQLPLLGPVMFDDWGDDDGTNRENISAVWTFETEDSVEPMRQHRAMVRHSQQERDELQARRHCEVDATCGPIDTDPHYTELGDSLDDPNDPSVSIDTSNLRALYSGAEFETVDADGAPERVGLSIYIPDVDENGDDCSGDFDVVIAGHGLGADRWISGLTVANEMAASSCLATVAMDFPNHGGRTPGVDDPHPDSTPQTSGNGFVSGDFVDAKQNFVRSSGDLFALVRVIEGDGDSSGFDGIFAGLDVAPVFDDAPTFGAVAGYVGISLGGIVGVPFAAMEPAVESVALHGAGGRLNWILEGDEEGVSVIGAPIVQLLEDEFGITPDDEEFFDTMVFAQWLVDRVDPFVFAQPATSSGDRTLMYDEEDGFGPVTGQSCEDDDECPDSWQCDSVGDDDLCVEYVPPVQPMLQMADGDRVVVNRSTRALADELGIGLEDTTFDEVGHAFVTVFDEDDDQYEAGVCARLQIGAFIDSGLFGDAELPADLSAQECLQN